MSARRSWAGRAVLLGVLSILPAGAAATPPGRVDSLARYVDALGAFGFVGQVIVAEEDSVLIERSFGEADSSGRPVGPATRFAVGSVTKSLTGATIVRLAARRVLSLDDSLPRFFPRVPPDKRVITLRQLLTHRSGLPMDVEAIAESDSRDQVVREILAEPLRSRPGAVFAYSNAGFQLAAAAVEVATGRPFAAWVREEWLTPCGMTSSGVGAAAAQTSGDVADGRNEWRFLGSLRDWRQRWAGTGAGDLVSTARDLWRWSRAMQGSGPLARAELDTLLARRVALGGGRFYGLGLYLTSLEGAPDLVAIGGDVPGYHAAAWSRRDAPHRAIVVVASGEQFGRRLLVNAVERRLWRLLEGGTVAPPPEPLRWPGDRLAAIAGAWRLAGGGRLELVREGNHLRAGLAGSPAMDLVFGPDSGGAREWLDVRAERLLRAAASPDDSALAVLLHPVERTAWLRALREGVRDCEARTGTPLDVVVDGTVPLPWLARGTRTYARLLGPGGGCDVSLAWLDGGLLDVAFGEGRPQPVILPVAPVAEGGLAAWDPLEGRLLRIEPFADGKGPGLLLTGAGGRDVARRAVAAR